MPKSKLGQFGFFFVAQFLSYFLIVANTRAYTQGNYQATAITDALFAAENFAMMRLIGRDKEAGSFAAGLGYTVGGTIGSLVSIYVTKMLLGQ